MYLKAIPKLLVYNFPILSYCIKTIPISTYFMRITDLVVSKATFQRA